MPVSCRIVFDVLSTLEPGEHPVRELAEMCRLSPAQVWRALRRLEGAHLIRRTSPGRGRRPAAWQVLWKSFPQLSVSPRPKQRFTQGGLDSHTDPPVSAKALRWALGQVRRELRGWPIPWPRRRELLAACAVALGREFRRGPPGGWRYRAWGRLVRAFVARLREKALEAGRRLYAQLGGMARALREESLGPEWSADILSVEVRYATNPCPLRR